MIKASKEIKETAKELKPNCHYVLKYLKPDVFPREIKDFVKDCKKHKIWIHPLGLFGSVNNATIEGEVLNPYWKKEWNKFF